MSEIGVATVTYAVYGNRDPDTNIDRHLRTRELSPGMARAKAATDMWVRRYGGEIVEERITVIAIVSKPVDMGSKA